jgi:hypothetical protein
VAAHCQTSKKNSLEVFEPVYVPFQLTVRKK